MKGGGGGKGGRKGGKGNVKEKEGKEDEGARKCWLENLKEWKEMLEGKE